VNLDDLEDNISEDEDEAIDLAKAKNELSSGSGGSQSTSGAVPENLFAVGESNDKGLADMETGSEVYMSELLVSFFRSKVWVMFVGWFRYG